MKFKFLFIAIICLTSCTVFNNIEDEYLQSTMGGHTLYYSTDFDGLDTYIKISAYIKSHVQYDTLDNTGVNKNPYDTLSDGKGSCGDIAVLFMNIAYYGMHIKMSFIAVNVTSRTIVSGGAINHAQVYYNGVCIEPKNGCPYSTAVGYLYSFDEVFLH